MSATRVAADTDVDVPAELYRSLARLVRELRRSTASAPVGPTATGVLFTLSRAERGMRLGEIADAEGISGPSLTRIVHSLVDLDLVVRTPDPDDKRCQLVSITQPGRELIASGTETRLAELRRRFGALPEGDRDRLRTVLPVLEALAGVSERW